ncbi:protein kinase domain-containing protein, partial [Mycobacterium szulgai]|uniref:protein kinase domain-containing protein n=1 Tax=Mycobacterium szulgai TaxID=1787 RepID=UPI00146FA358
DVVSELAAAGFSEAVQVGQGGLGVVYRCVQQALARVVAVKILTAQFADDRARFVREQQAMARLTSHPNIVTVLQVGQTASDRLFLVMPYCGQGAWQARIARLGVLDFEEVLRVGVKIAGAVESAHRLAIVHRDIKPANILLTDYGEPALGDFGIARTATGLRTETGALAGSPAFTAPEILTGQPPTAASDVYSLGATLFTALTGHAPFQRRAGEQMIAQFIRISSQPLAELNEHDIPADVAALVEHAMAREPTDRPSALELGQALQQIQRRRGLAVDEMALHCSDDALQPGPRPAPARAASTRRVPTLPAGVVGRHGELAQLRALLEQSRLVTLTGIGGVGKTTLATHAATELGTHFDDGVWLVELGDLHAGDLLAETVATALGLRDHSGRPMAEVLRQFLQPRHALLVLDTCEHLIDDAAKLVDTLLRECPALHVITTSREVLNIAGEAVLTLAPLTYPTAEDNLNLSSLTDYDAITLFVERARAAVPGFALTAHNAPAVARICTQLEGVPLAIELAAVRLRALSLDHIADDLARSYTLLNRGRRGAPTRQQSLTCCIDWSYERCSHAEQQLWAQLSVFAGSF